MLKLYFMRKYGRRRKILFAYWFPLSTIFIFRNYVICSLYIVGRKKCLFLAHQNLSSHERKLSRYNNIWLWCGACTERFFVEYDFASYSKTNSKLPLFHFHICRIGTWICPYLHWCLSFWCRVRLFCVLDGLLKFFKGLVWTRY